MKVEIKILNKAFYDKYRLPHYATNGSVGLDLYATSSCKLLPGEQVSIHTGIALHLGSHDDKLLRSFKPQWRYMAMIVPRSGLGSMGLVLANTVGIIDEDYQGPIIIKAWNRDKDREFTIQEGDKIAQLVIVPTVQAEWVVREEFSKSTKRGEGGFGSTGL